MTINSIEMQYQSHPDNKPLIICTPPWQKIINNKAKTIYDPDTIGEFGCLTCAKVNARNLFYTNYWMSIKEANQLIIDNDGYEFLYQMSLSNDLDEVKAKCLGRESYQIPAIVNPLFNIKKERDFVARDQIQIHIPNKFYIIKTKFQNTGHYSLLINEKLDYFDSYDGVVKPINSENLLGFKELIF
jgi:hypothetical protein